MNEELSNEERRALREVASTCLCQKARTAARALTRFYDRHFVGAGIEPTQFNLLTAIGLAGPVSLGRLAGYLGLERTTLTRNLAVLEREGIVETESTADARQRLLKLTKKGRETLRANLPRWKKAQQAARVALGTEKFGRMLDALSLPETFTSTQGTHHEN